jgi:elongation factor Tu
MAYMSTDASFRMTIADVFSIRGRGTVVTGRVEGGTLSVGDEVYIKGPAGSKRTVVTAIEAFRAQLERAGVGDNIGLLLHNIAREDVQRGDVVMGSEDALS